MKKFLIGTVAALAMMFTASASMACQQASIVAPAGYANMRAYPDLNAPIIVRLNNAGNGSEYGSLTYCGREYYDPSGSGRTWSFVTTYIMDTGEEVSGWVSDKVLYFH